MKINEKLKSNNVVVRILGNEDKNKGSIIILKDKKINRMFWNRNHFVLSNKYYRK